MKSPVLKYYILTSWIIFTFLLPTYSQNYHLQVQKHGIEDGLSSYNIEFIYQDKKGFTWIGTDYGLNRYDGQNFKVYTKEENGLPHNRIIAINEDEKGNLWLFGGIKGEFYFHVVFDPIKEKIYSLEEYTGQKVPFREAHTWADLLVNGSILYQMHRKEDATKFRYYEYNGKQFEEIFLNISDSLLQTLRFGSDLFKLSDGNYHIFNHSLPYSLIMNKEGQVIGTYHCPKTTSIFKSDVDNDEICTLCSNESHIYHYYNDKDSTSDINFIPLKEGARFVTSNRHTYLLDKDSLTIYTPDGNKSIQLASPIKINNFANISAVDRSKNFWTKNGEYLYMFSIIQYPFKVELTNENNWVRLRGITRAPTGALLVSTYNFIFHQHLDSVSSWGDFSVDSLKVPPAPINYLGSTIDNNNLWAGAEDGIVFHYNFGTRKMTRYHLFHNNTVAFFPWQPFVDSKGRVWVGTSSGLFLLDKEANQFKQWNVEGSELLSNSVVYSLHENKEGIWLSTTNGLFCLNMEGTEIIANYSSQQEGNQYIPSSHIAHLYEDKEGVFWLATKGDGLIQWNPKTKKYKQYTQNSDGLSHNVLYAVYGDNFGQLWLSSQRGLMQFDKETKAVNIYLKENGLPHNEFNT
ncbi:MAG: hypothetical protein JKY03_09015, partial [Aureispira sp.]|nr:hypothetical protein [Aureispira sp.]